MSSRIAFTADYSPLLGKCVTCRGLHIVEKDNFEIAIAQW